MENQNWLDDLVNAGLIIKNEESYRDIHISNLDEIDSGHTNTLQNLESADTDKNSSPSGLKTEFTPAYL